jgi:diacylglycerol kinase (ATP)
VERIFGSRVKAETLVIVNPASGGGRALRAEPLVASFLAERRRPAEFVHSTSAEDIREKAGRAAAAGYRYVVALGGDGAFHHVVEGLLGMEAVAGFFPAGNGNDIAAALDIPADPVAAAEAFLRARVRRVDLVRVRTADGKSAHFVGAGGLGLDAEAAHLANTRFKVWPGVARYMAGAIRAFFHEPLLEVTAEFDGERWAGRALFVAVANGPRYGSGMRIEPKARIDDGWLDVVIVGELTAARLFEALPIVLTTGNVRFSEVQRYRCRRATVRTSRAAKVHGDGEALGETPAEFEILPGALRVMAPEPATPGR